MNGHNDRMVPTIHLERRTGHCINRKQTKLQICPSNELSKCRIVPFITHRNLRKWCEEAEKLFIECAILAIIVQSGAHFLLSSSSYRENPSQDRRYMSKTSPLLEILIISYPS